MFFAVLFVVIFILSRAHGQQEGACSSNVTCGGVEGCDIWKGIISSDVIAFLNGDNKDPPHEELHANMQKAVHILSSYGSLITTDRLLPHITIQYLCCYSLGEYSKIADAIRKVKWKPLPVTFANLTCNVGGDDMQSARSLIIRLSRDSQNTLAHFVEEVEHIMENEMNIPVHRRRKDQEFFHSTLAVVREDYPVKEALLEVNNELRNWTTTPILIDSMIMLFPPHRFHSNT